MLTALKITNLTFEHHGNQILRREQISDSRSPLTYNCHSTNYLHEYLYYHILADNLWNDNKNDKSQNFK